MTKVQVHNNYLPNHIINIGKKFGFEFDNLDKENSEFITYQFHNYPLPVINTLKRILTSELTTLAYSKENFTNYINNTQINNEVIKNEMEFFSKFNDDFKSEIQITHPYGPLCNAVATKGRGLDHAKWQVLNVFYKFATQDDMEQQLMNESLDEKRNYLKDEKGNPQIVLMTIEKLYDNIRVFNEDVEDKDVLVSDIKEMLKIASSILIEKINFYVENNVNSSELIIDSETETFGNFLESLFPKMTTKISDGDLYIYINSLSYIDVNAKLNDVIEKFLNPILKI